MKSIKFIAVLCIFAMAISACSHPKPHTASGDITKTTVKMAGKKDSVINNPQQNYGTATVSEPCVKCLLQVIQASKSYKTNTAGIAQQNIKYAINWVKASAPQLKPDTSKATNALRIDVKKNATNADSVVCSYVYNNQSGTMYLLDGHDKKDHEISSITPEILKRIRNSCYWGVASGK